MARTSSNPLAKGKTKAHRPHLRASPRLAALRSRGIVQPQLQAPDILAENIPMLILSPKKWRIGALHRAKNQASEEHEKDVIALSSDSEHEKDEKLEADAKGALPVAEEGAEETLSQLIKYKGEVYNPVPILMNLKSDLRLDLMSLYPN
ncbi:hypothetical protein PIB30_088888 [Stylosanthes scabra]|uniref:Uncharacterized protein n=1 Tax=Stylosanthes scabra TaxID=79078 RepID=A0ABU6ZSI4_9FABA|nr:hypothetical protein [Stylosanthes scabra]